MKQRIFAITILFVISLSHLNAQTKGSFTDSRDGKTYKTVKIGEQIWMAENLVYKTDNGCWVYNNNQVNVAKYGYLYNYEIAKNVCPVAWHLPTKAEYETLLNNYGGDNNLETNYTALIPNGSSGFLALFGGAYSEFAGIFLSEGADGNFWSASAFDNEHALGLSIYSSNMGADFGSSYKSNGYSVRCVKK